MPVENRSFYTGVVPRDSVQPMQGLPEIPAQEIALGLASAVLFLLAAYQIIRPRAGGTWVRGAGRPDPLIPSFLVEVEGDSPARRLSFIGSLFLHLFGIALAPWLQVMFPGPLPFHIPRHQAITLQYHIPLPPLIAPEELERFTEERESEREPHPDGDSDDPKLALNEAANREESGVQGAAPAAHIKVEASAQTSQVARKQEAALPPDEPAAPEENPPSAPENEQTESAEAEPPLAREEPEIELSPPEVVKLLLPNVVQTNPALKDIVLQPDFTVPLPQDYLVELPPVLLWQPEPPALSDLTILQPAPGQGEPPSRIDLPDIQPQLRPPNELPRIADLQLQETLAFFEDPQLPLPPSDVIPLAGRRPDQLQAETPSISGGRGENSLIVLAEDPDIRATTFLLEPGLRLGSIEFNPAEMPEGVVGGTGPPGSSGRTPGAGDLAEAPSPLRTSAPGSEGASRGSEDGPAIWIYRGGQGAGSVQVVRVTPGGGHSREGSTAGEPQMLAENRPVGGGEGTDRTEHGRGSDGKGTGEAGPLGQPDGSPTGRGRLRPLPRARYGIILISNARSALPEAAEVLTGNPIYTAYLNVPEARRKWVLQYCQPAASSHKLDISDGVVRVRPRKRLDPPFPIQQDAIDLRPGETSVRGAKRRVVVYATFDGVGQLANLRMIRGADPETDRTILEALLSWEFLPAFQDGTPVPVEVLFGIPL